MLQVGTYENIVVLGAEVANDGVITITMKQVSGLSKLARLSKAATDRSGEDQSQDFKLWAIKNVDWQGAPRDAEAVLKDIETRQSLLTFILSQYMTVDKIDMDFTKGVGLTDSNLDTKIVEQSTLDKINQNLGQLFVKQLKPFQGESGKKFYATFVRTSAKSHFPKLRDRFLDSQPFLAPMSDPDGKNKVAFTKYELDKGLNKGDKVSAEAPVATPEETSTINNLFGGEETAVEDIQIQFVTKEELAADKAAAEQPESDLPF